MSTDPNADKTLRAGGIGLLVATMAAPIVAAALDVVITHG